MQMLGRTFLGSIVVLPRQRGLDRQKEPMVGVRQFDLAHGPHKVTARPNKGPLPDRPASAIRSIAGLAPFVARIHRRRRGLVDGVEQPARALAASSSRPSSSRASARKPRPRRPSPRPRPDRAPRPSREAGFETWPGEAQPRACRSARRPDRRRRESASGRLPRTPRFVAKVGAFGSLDPSTPSLIFGFVESCLLDFLLSHPTLRILAGLIYLDEPLGVGFELGCRSSKASSG